MSLPTFDGRQSGDIRFQFRTTATSGLFLRNDGIGKDFIEVRLVTNRVVNFRYDVGNGIQVSDEIRKCPACVVLSLI